MTRTHWLLLRLQRRGVVFTGLVLAALGLVLTQAGCVEQSTTGSQEDTGEVSKAISSEALLEGAIDTLNRMDEYVNLDLRPPRVVLDSTTSKNRRPPMARLIDNPSNPTGNFNFLHVVSRNGWFRKLEVRPGDQVRFFALVDEYGKQSDIKLTVSEVVNDNALLIEGALNEAVYQPTRFEIWRFTNEKVDEMSARMENFKLRSPSRPGWEPTVDEAALQQVVERLNQWLRDRKAGDTWQPDPLVKTLPNDPDNPDKDLQKFASPKLLGANAFAREDAQLLQEAVWLRDISRWVGNGELDRTKLSAQLFDWTVRNIQLEKPGTPGLEHYRPWHILIYGRGTAEQRAWIFLHLARQQSLDAAMLAYQDADTGKLKPWLPAVLIDGKWTLWDTSLGLPIPGSGKGGVATLQEVRDDEQLLRQLDLDEEHPYPVKADDLKHVVALLEASPFYLSKRVSLVEARMAGDLKVILSCQPTKQAEKFEKTGAIASVKLWDLPYRTLLTQHSLKEEQRLEAIRQYMPFLGQPRYWKARVLHFQGKLEGKDAAMLYYRLVRPSDARLRASRLTPLEKVLVLSTKRDASYFLGLATFEKGDYPTAIDFLDKRTLQASPQGPWTQGAKYNLARSYEASGQIDKAVALYLTDTSAQSHGNQLRGRSLKQALTAEKPEPEKPEPEKPEAAPGVE